MIANKKMKVHKPNIIKKKDCRTKKKNEQKGKFEGIMRAAWQLQQQLGKRKERSWVLANIKCC